MSGRYVYDVGDTGVDDLLAQFQGPPPDASGEPRSAPFGLATAAELAIQSRPWWVISDASGDPAA